MIACPVIRDLYGYAEPVLDEDAAHRALSRHNLRGPALAAAMTILRERAQHLGG
jgi:hypothetical protein